MVSQSTDPPPPSSPGASPLSPERADPPTVPSSPRISFSSDFLDDTDFISISPHSHRDLDKTRNPDFEFLSSIETNDATYDNPTMIDADQLFFEGKLLPFWRHSEDRLTKIKIKNADDQDQDQERTVEIKAEAAAAVSSTWFVDEDPSPRPPKCTVLWKELLRLKKQRNVSSLSPSSSTSSSSSSTMSAEEERKGKEGGSSSAWSKEKHVRRIKKGLERTRSASMIRIRPIINVPICTTHHNMIKTPTSSSLPPLFPLKNGRFLERYRN